MGQMGRLLEEVRGRVDSVRGPLGFLARRALRVGPPSWFRRDDELMEVFRRQGLLLREGSVAWGALVQANFHLFQPGPHDHPAMTIYSADRAFDDDPGGLGAIAHRLFELKNTTPSDPGERRLAEMITDEQERGMGWTVPKGCTGGREVRSTTFMVFRRHLPGGVLRSGWFPLLVHAATPAVMIVPSRFWPEELVGLWSSGA